MGGSKVTLVAFVWLFYTVYFKMPSQGAFHRGWKPTLVALVWFFLFICVSQGNINIDLPFTKIITHKNLIHLNQVVDVVPCALSVSNWENEDWGLEERTNESESHSWIHNMKGSKTIHPRPDQIRTGDEDNSKTYLATINFINSHNVTNLPTYTPG